MVAEIALCGKPDVDLAIDAARSAFTAYSTTALEVRLALLERLEQVFTRRYEEMVTAITTEMGAPSDLSRASQAACGPGHIKATIEAARELNWETRCGTRGNLVREPVGVCALITPWNWPMNQLAAKVAPALAAGCTVVLKPSELAPLSAQLFAERFSMRRDLRLACSTCCTAPVPKSASRSLPTPTSTWSPSPVQQGPAFWSPRPPQIPSSAFAELGGKSPNIIFADADLPRAIKRGVLHCFNNSGQSCNAPTRMLVEASVYQRAVVAVEAGAKVPVGDPTKPGPQIGPVVSKSQWDKIQSYIKTGVDRGGEDRARRTRPARAYRHRLLRATNHLR